MRPLCLTVSAFGPYAGLQKLDFAELKGRSFFLIHGPTGSGKTTILDAMCFALYGDTSGALRDSKTVRSDHADRQTATEVEFDFAVGSSAYRIMRSPEQERPKKRGEGTTVRAAEATLWKLDGEGAAQLMATGWNDVTKKVEWLLGFKSNQFRQVVLLPQGDFRKLLTANSSERQEIMQTLFKTELYRLIEEKLKTKGQELKKNFDELHKERQWTLNEAATPSGEELSQRLNGNEQLLAGVAAELAQVSEQLQQARNAVTEGRIIQDKLAERDNATAALNGMNEKAPVVEQYRLELGKAQQAAGLFDAENIVKRLGEDVAALAIAYASQANQLEQAAAGLTVAEQALAAEAAREGEREAVAGELLRLNELGQKLQALTEAERGLALRQQAAGQALTAKEAISTRLAEIKSAEQTKTAEYHKLLEQSAQAGIHKAEWDEAQRQLDKKITLDRVRQQVSEAQQLLNTTEQTARQLENSYLTAKAEFSGMQTAWTRGQAAIMAASLTPGTPCPVCGAYEHPQLALSDAQLPGENQLKAKQDQLETLEQQREIYRADLSSQHTNHNTLTQRMVDLEQELGSKAETAVAVLVTKAQAAQAGYEQAAAAECKAKAVSEDLTRLLDAQAETAEKLEQAEAQWQKADNAVKSAEAIVNERRLAVPRQFHDPVVLAQAQQAAADRQRKLKDSFEQAQQTVQDAKQRLAKSQAAFENTGSNLQTARERRQTEQAAFAERLTAAGFRDEAEYNSAKKPPAYVEKLTERIQLFDREFIAAGERLERATAAAEGLAVPDMAGLEQAVSILQAKHTEQVANHANLTAQIERERQWLAKLHRLDANIENIAEQYKVLGRLAEVANGGNEYKLTFQRFVLGALLDDVAIAANERLKTMSRGRYYLQRTMDRARKNAAGGLDLEVFDQYTGVARGVGTLSGGETFLASLALALGLADVVQTYAGGIHLDTILVDEGFGTLDPEALDFAVKALIDLQKGGRLVGIISHVPELKERIDARLEVLPTQHGSTACFRVG